jgi:hypothetical protein
MSNWKVIEQDDNLPPYVRAVSSRYPRALFRPPIDRMGDLLRVYRIVDNKLEMCTINLIQPPGDVQRDIVEAFI